MDEEEPAQSGDESRVRGSRGGFLLGDEGTRPDNGFPCRSSLGLRQWVRDQKSLAEIWRGGTFALRGAQNGTHLSASANAYEAITMALAGVEGEEAKNAWEDGRSRDPCPGLGWGVRG